VVGGGTTAGADGCSDGGHRLGLVPPQLTVNLRTKYSLSLRSSSTFVSYQRTAS
jgi:hypothetical protein